MLLLRWLNMIFLDMNEDKQINDLKISCWHLHQHLVGKCGKFLVHILSICHRIEMTKRVTHGQSIQHMRHQNEDSM